MNPYFQVVKFSIYYYWIKESYRINKNNLKLQKKAQLFKELQLEIVKFNTAIQKAKEEKEKEEEELNKPVMKRWWPFSTKVEIKKEEKSVEPQMYWPFEDFRTPEEEEQ